eukprot:scaffold3.g6324.t1
MDCNCNCFGVATAAKVPVKRYNLLVPDIYPVVEPPFDRPLGIAIERKVKKLAEYVERNEHRAPKVSRRLARRLYADLGRRRYGYVHLTVEAYAHLLREGRPERSGLFANELVARSVEKRKRDWLVGPKREPAISSQLGSVVGRLLSHGRTEVRALGVDLLVQFLRLQTTSDYVTQLEGFVALLCRDANPRLPFSGAGGAAPEALAALRAACLRALLEHLRFCARASYVSHHLDALTYVVLDNIEHGELAARASDLEAARAAAQAAGHGANTFIRRLSIGARVGASPPDLAALLVFEQLSHITRDGAEGKKVVEFVLRYLDQGGRWLGGPVLATSMLVLRQACEQEHQRYLLFLGLMRHVGAAQLAPAERAAVLSLAVGEGLHLEPGLASPALLLALQELPAVLAGAAADAGGGQRSGAAPAGGAAAAAAAREVELAKRPSGGAAPPVTSEQLPEAVLLAVERLAERLDGAMQLLEVVGAAVGQLRSPAPVSTAALQCCVAAAGAVTRMPSEVSGPTSALTSFPQQLLQRLASIMATWEVAQRLLAHRLLAQLLPAAARGLREGQARVAVSALWHAASNSGNPPAAYVAADAAVGALLAASGSQASALLEATQMAGALQAAAARPAEANGAERGSPSRAVAVLLLCRSLLQRLAAALDAPALASLGVPGCEGVLTSLQAGAVGLQLAAAAGDGPSNGAVDGFASAAAAAVVFDAEEDSRAAEFLAAWRGGTRPEAEAARFAAAADAVPAFAALPTVRRRAAFDPLPAASLAPRLKAAGAYAGGSTDSAAAEESKWAQHVRALYHSVSLAREGISTSEAPSGSPRSLAASEDAQAADAGDAEWDEGAAANGGAGAGKTVDEVLAEVDSALEAVERQVAKLARAPSAGGAGASPFAVAGGRALAAAVSLDRLDELELPALAAWGAQCHAPASFGSQDDLLAADDALSAFCQRLGGCAPAPTPAPSEPFPCLADELELEAKELEVHWPSAAEPLLAAAAPGAVDAQMQANVGLVPMQLAGLPALRHSLANLANQQQQRHQQQQQAATAVPSTRDAVPSSVQRVPSANAPKTPTRPAPSNDSSCNESLAPAGDNQPEVQSPVRPPLRHLPSALRVPAAPPCGMVLESALHPGPAAAVNLLDLSPLAGPLGPAQEAQDDAEAEARDDAGGGAAARRLQRAAASGSSKRKARGVEEESEDESEDESEGDEELSSGSAAGGHTSGFSAAASRRTVSSGSKRARRAGASAGAASLAAEAAAAAAEAAAAASEPASESDGGFSSSSEDDEEGPAPSSYSQEPGRSVLSSGTTSTSPVPAVTPRLAARSSPAKRKPKARQGRPRARAAKPKAKQAKAKARQAKPARPAKSAKQLKRQQKRPRAAAGVAAAAAAAAASSDAPPPERRTRPVRHASAGVAAAVAAAAPAERRTAAAASPAGTPHKAGGRQQPKTPDAGPRGSRSSGSRRRVILAWTSGSVVDPRTGQRTAVVEPAAFCTQCFSTSTPVWRAGPFGVKTLCNACGVRWMKSKK